MRAIGARVMEWFTVRDVMQQTRNHARGAMEAGVLGAGRTMRRSEAVPIAMARVVKPARPARAAGR